MRLHDTPRPVAVGARWHAPRHDGRRPVRVGVDGGRMTEKSEIWQEWLANQDRWNGDYWYRGVYAAWHCTVGATPNHGGEAHLWVGEDGGFFLSTNARRDPLRFDDADEVRAFAAWLERRCCGDRYPDMQA